MKVWEKMVKVRGKKIEWEAPVLMRLGDPKCAAFGTCGDGSGDTADCGNGSYSDTVCNNGTDPKVS